MNQPNIIVSKEILPMKVIDMSSKTNAKAYLGAVEDSHSKEELESLQRAIRFTHMFKHEESMAKMDEELALERPMPNLPQHIIKKIVG